MPEALADAPPLPPEGAYLWGFFADLHSARGSSGFGPSPLAFSDIEAWSRLSGNHLDPWELRAILGIDAQYMASAAEAANPKGK